MRGNFFAQVTSLNTRRIAVLHLLIKQADLRLQLIKLLLLAIDRAVQFIDQILGEAQFAFEVGYAIFHGFAAQFLLESKSDFTL